LIDTSSTGGSEYARFVLRRGGILEKQEMSFVGRQDRAWQLGMNKKH
jgi:hypothetical protein